MHVFSIPKALRVFFRHDQRLFSEVSSLIFSMITNFYQAAARTTIRSAAVIAYQPFGDLLRFNSHWHALILEGGFDAEDQFVFLPIHDTQKLTECFRRRVIALFLRKNIIAEGFSEMLLSWRHSGFSVNNSVRMAGDHHKVRVSLAQYIARAPLSLEKLHYDLSPSPLPSFRRRGCDSSAILDCIHRAADGSSPCGSTLQLTPRWDGSERTSKTA